ncbi:MAG: VPGUxxT family thioredoxin-like (seleno)protein, type 2 [Verrucomicrobiales bacterium]
MKYLSIVAASVLVLAISATVGKNTPGSSQPIEVGVVKWGRDFTASLAAAKRSGKPVFLLFQEVPGCAGCKKFGGDVLSHPLLAEAIEDEFVPMLVHNNAGGGADVEILKRYQEPAWNYQVIRFLDPAGRDLIPRRDRVWTMEGVAARMIAALDAAGREVPAYLQGLAPEDDSADIAFAMSCFWTGECELGKIDGVISTEAGWLDGREVTRVRYLPGVVDIQELTAQASAAKCADRVYPTPGKGYKKAKASDQARQIRSLDLDSIPGLTELQLTKLNALLRTEPKKAMAWLSPRQQQALSASLGKKRSPRDTTSDL